MNFLTKLTLAGYLLLASVSLRAQIMIGGYYVYYGHLHNHTSYSDGQGTPALAYTTARANRLDFFGLAEHSNALDATEWADTQAAAEAAYVPGTFTTFRGFEWTTSNYGHVAVINTPSLVLTSDPGYDTFTELVTWLNTQPSDCFAFLNHPGGYNKNGTEFNHFANAQVTDKIVGMEQWNKANGFPAYYAGLSGVMITGYFSEDGVSFYDEALQRGWNIAPEGSEDNHVATWGSLTSYKTAVLANANTREDLTAAFKARRFYTTEDLNTAMSFKINGNEMGSTVLPGTYTMQIQLSDGDNETFSKVELMRNGMVTSTWTPGIANVNISQQITCSDGEYYYIRVYQSGSLTAFSAPVRISTGVVNVFPVIQITSPLNSSVFQKPSVITLEAEASDSDGSIAKVEFYQGTTKLGEDTSAPYSFAWDNQVPGACVITAKATDNLGAVTTSLPVNIAVYDANLKFTVSQGIVSGSDDAEEGSTGTMYLTSTDLELVYDTYNSAGNQAVGMRFTNLLIPRGAYIRSSYIQFTCDEITGGACYLTIRGEAADNSRNFTSTAGNISSRAKTAASVSWIPSDWPAADVAGIEQRTPDLTAIVQEIANRPGFTPSSPVTFIITGTGTRTAEAYEGVLASAPRLIVVFATSPPVTPLFSAIGPLYQNSAPPALPPVSVNGITGTWNPSVISTASTGTTVYTFTPAFEQNAESATLQVTVIPSESTVFEIPVSQSSDDGEEYNSGSVVLNEKDLELVYNSKATGNQKVGLRFNDVNIPNGAFIVSAAIQFTASTTGTGTANLTVQGEAADNPVTFSARKKNISGRTKTTASASWTPPGWTIGTVQATSELKAIVQQLVSRVGWTEGNSMVFIFSGTGTRKAVSFDKSSTGAPRLHIEYFPPATKKAVIPGNRIALLSMEEPSAGILNCYPVPFCERLNISFKPVTEEAIQSIAIYTISGNLIMKYGKPDNEMSFNMESLAAGVYLLSARTNRNMYFKTIIKN